MSTARGRKLLEIAEALRLAKKTEAVRHGVPVVTKQATAKPQDSVVDQLINAAVPGFPDKRKTYQSSKKRHEEVHASAQSLTPAFNQVPVASELHPAPQVYYFQ